MSNNFQQFRGKSGSTRPSWTRRIAIDRHMKEAKGTDQVTRSQHSSTGTFFRIWQVNLKGREITSHGYTSPATSPVRVRTKRCRSTEVNPELARRGTSQVLQLPGTSRLSNTGKLGFRTGMYSGTKVNKMTLLTRSPEGLENEQASQSGSSATKDSVQGPGLRASPQGKKSKGGSDVAAAKPSNQNKMNQNESKRERPGTLQRESPVRPSQVRCFLLESGPSFNKVSKRSI